MTISPERLAAINRIDNVVLEQLVDAIDSLMSNHPEPYRTLAECLIMSRGEGAVHDMCNHITQAVAEDCTGPRSQWP